MLTDIALILLHGRSRGILGGGDSDCSVDDFVDVGYGQANLHTPHHRNQNRTKSGQEPRFVRIACHIFSLKMISEFRKVLVTEQMSQDLRDNKLCES